MTHQMLFGNRDPVASIVVASWIFGPRMSFTTSPTGAREPTARRTRVVGLPVHLEAAPLDLVAEVLATIDGDPMRLIDGEPLREQ